MGRQRVGAGYRNGHRTTSGNPLSVFSNRDESNRDESVEPFCGVGEVFGVNVDVGGGCPVSLSGTAVSAGTADGRIIHRPLVQRTSSPTASSPKGFVVHPRGFAGRGRVAALDAETRCARGRFAPSW